MGFHVGLGIGLTSSGSGGSGVPSWVPDGGVLAFEFDNQRGYNSRNLATTTPDSILTYTAPSPKLVYGSDGVLRYAPHNLLLQSQTFDNAYWTKNSGGISADAGVSPSSLADADKLIGVASATQQWVYRTTSITVANGVSHTVSCYMKADGYNFGQLRIVTGGTNANVGFNISTGAIYSTAAGSGTITDVGGGWYRCTATGTSDSTSAQVYINVSDTASLSKSFTGDGTSGILIWGAQLNLGSSALTYIPTTTAARYSLPIDHNPTTFEPLGVLIEEQRTNLLTYSEQFDNAAWVKSNITIAGASINAIVAPDGTTTADKIEATASAATTLRQQRAVTATTATFSIYVKIGSAATHANKFALYNVTTAADLLVINFNYSTGLITYTVGSAGASAVELDDGWWRITLSASSGITSGDTIQVYPCFVGGSETAGEFAYLWGAQLEAGAFATSYIPTVASQVTRAADQVSILTSAFAWSYSEGTAVMAMMPYQVGDTATRTAIGIDTNGRLLYTNGTTVRAYDGTNVVLSLQSMSKDTLFKAAVSFGGSGLRLSTQGNAVVSNSFDGVMGAGSSLNIGHGVGSAFGGWIKRVTMYPTEKSNAELQALTA